MSWSERVLQWYLALVMKMDLREATSESVRTYPLA
jgi:hypothetical protein